MDNYQGNNDWNNQNQQIRPHTPVIIVGEQNPAQHRSNSNLAVTSLVLGILSIVFCWIFYIGLILGIIGLVLGIVSIAQGRDGQKLAVAGMITSGIGGLIALIIGLMYIVALFMFT